MAPHRGEIQPHGSLGAVGIGGGRGTYTSRGRGQCCQTKQNNRRFGPGGEKAGKHEKTEKGAPILHIPARKNAFPVYEALAAAGADTKAMDREGNETMHVAAISGSMDFATKLIEHGIKPKSNSRNAWPSQLATGHHHPELAHMLQTHEPKADHTNIAFLKRGGDHQTVRQRYSDRGGFVYRKQKV